MYIRSPNRQLSFTDLNPKDAKNASWGRSPTNIVHVHVSQLTCLSFSLSLVAFQKETERKSTK